ncbi:hypothetical protein AAGS40_26845 (plasmid) [Paraburkholderia sp. PREW-6R]|uniref:hypothetical protein n=1 Tax=Paraburkholderia sp. PREW-6R TaxID=3141544 RepID=UPI0031F4A746
MDKTQIAGANPNNALPADRSVASHTASTEAATTTEDLAAFTAGITREVADLVARAEMRATLAAERRVLQVVRRLVDERAEAACTQARSEQVIAELQTRLAHALSDVGALKAQLEFVRAVAGAVPVSMSAGTVPARKPDLVGPRAVQPGEVVQLSAARYLIRNPWPTDLTGRPFISSGINVIDWNFPGARHG